MEPNEIWERIVKADEALKYATEEKGEARRGQAKGWLTQAKAEAEAIGNQPLVEQADRRLADLAQIESGSANA